MVDGRPRPGSAYAPRPADTPHPVNLLPEWAPNVHPLVVHFPIALVVVAALADAVALVVRRRAYRVAAAALYAAAAVGAIAAYVTGNAAGESVLVEGGAVGALNAHADAARWAAWGLGAYGLLRLAVAVWDRRGRLALHLGLAALGLVGVGFVWVTAERGARLVFEYGVGVRAAERGVEAERTASSPGGFTGTPGGGWRWEPAPGAGLPAAFDVLEGDAEALHVTAEGDSVVVLHLDRGPVLLVAGEPAAGTQLDARLDASGFDGSVRLVHHLRDPECYDYLGLESGDAVQGRVAEGGETVFDRGAVTARGPVRLRVVGLGTHFRGYADGAMVTHGHGDAAPAGRAGLRLDGSGRLRLYDLEMTPLAE